MFERKVTLREKISALTGVVQFKESQIRGLRKDLEESKKDTHHYREAADKINADKIKAENEKLKTEISTQNDTIRKQTEADLLLNALHAVGLVKGPKDVDHFEQAKTLEQRLNESKSEGYRKFDREHTSWLGHPF